MSKVMKTMDGNEAAAHVSYAFTEVAGIFPITPSSPMAEYSDEWAARGKKNMFGQTVKIVEMQSEAGAAGTVHGSLQGGALTTTYTASQGLLLMIPNMYKIAGELLPNVIHVSARTVASHALSIFGDHSDVMACRQTGYAMLSSNSVQEVMDLGAVAHLATIKSRVPFLHFFDGFRTSHELQKIELLDYDDLNKLVDHDKIAEFRRNALNPEHPVLRGTAQNPDVFFQAKEASNRFYTEAVGHVEEAMEQISKLTGRDYKLFNYYGAPDAERVIIAMGSGCECMEETIDYLMSKGEKVGMVKVRLFRPFSTKHLLAALPKTAKVVTVLDRTKELGALGDPLYLDVATSVFESGLNVKLLAGRYGLSSKDVTPNSIIAVYDNMKSECRNHFTVGIVDDVTNLSLKQGDFVDVSEAGVTSCKFWGLGSDGTVGANKNSIKIITENTNLYGQAYFDYDSKKSGGVTNSHLRFGKSPIRSTYLVYNADFVACHVPSYIYQYDMVSQIKPGGTFLLNCLWNDKELEANLPAAIKSYIAKNNIKFYTINATDIAKELGLGNRTNTILQSAFFKLTNVIDINDAVKYMKKAIEKSYGRKGEKVVSMNYAAVDAGLEKFHKVEVPASWANAKDENAKSGKGTTQFVDNILKVVNAKKGDILPVSAFVGREDGTIPQGTAAFEKRSIAVDVPEWIPENCIQCNQCSYVCPHATIRPFLVSDADLAKAPADFVTKKPTGKGMEGLNYRIQVACEDCTGCGVCAQVCPSKEKAIVMKPIDSQKPAQMPNWDFAINLKRVANPTDKFTVKGSQFEQPLLEFSGACAGCGETAYAKLLTQLFGDRMIIANATGCSSIWGGSFPSTPYTTNQEGKGPAWANSLFEDNAEFGLGIWLANKQMRAALKERMEKGIASDKCPQDLKDVYKLWIENFTDGEGSKAPSAKIVELIEAHKGTEKCDDCKFIYNNRDFLVKKSIWIIGGDGWAYDIGFGGLDHVFASGEDVNILVLDTEIYSNTGGQSSKATPTAAIAKFAAAGKRTRKKDLGMIAMSYGSCYAAQVSMGSDYNQTLKAIKEAEQHTGPSVVIAYAPCISHGIKTGMSTTSLQQKKAVACGYWHLWRYNPMVTQGNPFSLDSKEPSESFRDFINGEVRYTSLTLAYPEVAEELFEAAQEDAQIRLTTYQRLVKNN